MDLSKSAKLSLMLVVLIFASVHSKAGWKNFFIEWQSAGGGHPEPTALAMDRPTGKLLMGVWPGVIQITYPSITPVHCETFGAAAGGDSVGAINRTRCFIGSPWGLFAYTNNDGSSLITYLSVYGISGYTANGGNSWKAFTPNQRIPLPIPATTALMQDIHIASIDWASNTILAQVHELPGFFFRSNDLGTTWVQLAAPNAPSTVNGMAFTYIATGVFSPSEMVYSYGNGILRSADSGKSWTTVTTAYTTQGVLQVFKGNYYWLSKMKGPNGRWSGQIITTKDKGLTWQPVGKPIDNGDSTYMCDPRFAEDESHIFMGSSSGIMESKDSGNTWTLLTLWPPNRYTIPQSPEGAFDSRDNLEYDPVHGVFYLHLSEWNHGPTWRYDTPWASVGIEKSASQSAAPDLSASVNPFNPGTTIRYSVPNARPAQELSIQIHSIQGRLIKTLVSGTLQPGAHSVEFDGKDRCGHSLPSGEYLCTLRSPGYAKTIRLCLIK